MDNTLFFYIVGDNGASAEGGKKASSTRYGLKRRPAKRRRCWSTSIIGGIRPPTPILRSAGPLPGTPRSRWTKQVASHFGGTRNGMVIHWPKADQGKGRDPQPVPPRDRRRADRSGSRRLAGTQDGERCRRRSRWKASAWLYTFDNAKAKERHTTQYFEMFGNRGIYHDGWLARVIHRAPWEYKPRVDPGQGCVGAL